MPVTVNMTLFINRVFADVFKIIWSHTGLKRSLNPMTGILVKKKKVFCRQAGRHTEQRWLCESEGRDLSDAATSQGMSGLLATTRG